MSSFWLYVTLGTVIFIVNLDGTLSLKCYQENSAITETTCPSSIANPVCMKMTTFQDGRVKAVIKSCGMQILSADMKCTNASNPLLPATLQETCLCNSNWCNSAVVERASGVVALGLVIFALHRF